MPESMKVPGLAVRLAQTRERVKQAMRASQRPPMQVPGVSVTLPAAAPGPALRDVNVLWGEASMPPPAARRPAPRGEPSGAVNAGFNPREVQKRFNRREEAIQEALRRSLVQPGIITGGPRPPWYIPVPAGAKVPMGTSGIDTRTFDGLPDDIRNEILRRVMPKAPE